MSLCRRVVDLMLDCRILIEYSRKTETLDACRYGQQSLGGMSARLGAVYVILFDVYIESKHGFSLFSIA